MEPVVKVFRGNNIESVHYGHLAVVDVTGKLLYKVGDPYFSTFIRSSAKPFQAIPVVESGAADKFGFTQKELAIIAGSHSGEPEHVETVQSILNKIGLDESALQCGTHIPHYYTANRIKPEKGAEFTPIYHNCSGKHSGMLAQCIFHGYSTEDYLEPSHPAQKAITNAIAEICDFPADKIGIGRDGCNAPVHALPIYNIANGFARLAKPDACQTGKSKVYSRIADAMLNFPRMVAGRGRYDTEVMQATNGRMILKVGAEGLSCAGMLDKGIGFAAKIADGAVRALYPFGLEALKQIGAVGDEEIDSLKQFHNTIIYNWSDKEVGRAIPDFTVDKA